LKLEIATYEKHREKLEKDHFGKYALVHDDQLIGVFDSFQEAAEEGLRLFGQGPFLVRQIGGPDPELPVALMLGLVNAHL